MSEFRFTGSSQKLKNALWLFTYLNCLWQTWQVNASVLRPSRARILKLFEFEAAARAPNRAPSWCTPKPPGGVARPTGPAWPPFRLLSVVPCCWRCCCLTTASLSFCCNDCIPLPLLLGCRRWLWDAGSTLINGGGLCCGGDGEGGLDDRSEPSDVSGACPNPANPADSRWSPVAGGRSGLDSVVGLPPVTWLGNWSWSSRSIRR